MANETILVVEDSPTELTVLKACLEKAGYHVVTATDGEEALRKAAEDKPPLVLLDIILPKRNGYQVLRELKSGDKTKASKVILVSSKNQESDRHWGMKQGADDYVMKPYLEATLLNAVTRQLATLQ